MYNIVFLHIPSFTDNTYHPNQLQCSETLPTSKAIFKYQISIHII